MHYKTEKGTKNQWEFKKIGTLRTPWIKAPALAMLTTSKCNKEAETSPATAWEETYLEKEKEASLISATALELSPLRKMCFFAVDSFTWSRTWQRFSFGDTYTWTCPDN